MAWLDTEQGLINLDHVISFHFLASKDCDGKDDGTNLACVTTDREVTLLGLYPDLDDASDALDKIIKGIKARRTVIEFLRDYSQD